MHDCPCCGMPVYNSGNPYTYCVGCNRPDSIECDPATTWHCDGRNGHHCDGTACEEYDVPSDTRPLYDTCGCLYPCPDHKSPQQDGQRDREYWNDHYDAE